MPIMWQRDYEKTANGYEFYFIGIIKKRSFTGCAF